MALQSIPLSEFKENLAEISIPLNSDSMTSFCAGDLKLYLKQSENTVLFKNKYQRMPRLLRSKFHHDWQNILVSNNSSAISAKLYPPDRPVIIKPAAALHIAPHEKLTVYITLPANLALFYKENNIKEFASCILSNSWFGALDAGELCYCLKQNLSQSVPSDDSVHNIICPVEIENKSTSVLLFERFCLRTEFLNLYQDSQSKRLWSDVSKVAYLGKDKWSRLNYTPPAPHTSYKNISKARKQYTGNHLLLKSFETIKKFPVWG
jgi:hypothetical protein